MLFLAAVKFVRSFFRPMSNQVGCDTYYIRGIAVLDFQEVHRPDHGLHRHKNVLVHKFDKSSLVLVRIAGAVDNPHLLNEGGLARLASSCDKVSVSISSLMN